MLRLTTSRFAALLIGLSAAAACQADGTTADGTSIGRQSAAIVNGEVSHSDEQVVALVY